MTSKDWFAVAVRIIGLIVIIEALRYIASAVIVLARHPAGVAATVFDFSIPGVSGLVVGLYLLRGAPHVMRFAFPSKTAEKKDAPEV
jgi:hypothetical protein